MIVELQKISTMLFVAPEHGDSFWMESAKTGFVGVGAYVAAQKQLPFTINELYRRRTRANLQDYFCDTVQSDGALPSPARHVPADFTSGAEKTFLSILQSITSKLSLWLNPLVCAATSESDFDLRRLRSAHHNLSWRVTRRVGPDRPRYTQPLSD